MIQARAFTSTGGALARKAQRARRLQGAGYVRRFDGHVGLGYARSRPEELALVSGGYRAEVERMQREMLDYLTNPADTAAKAG